MPTWAVLAFTAAYVAGLFALAWWGDRRAADGRGAALGGRAGTVVYALSLAVYNTSWSFYGSVGRAATSGWDFLPIYLGPAIVLILAHPVLAKTITLAKTHNVTSVADFIAARYGKSRTVAAAVTLTSLLSVLPYIALQLKAVGTSFDVLTAASGPPAPWWTALWGDTALATTLAMAAFAILFGVRHIHASEHHRGLMLAVAFESVAKLACFLAVGFFIVFGLFDGLGDILARAASDERLAGLLAPDPSAPGWIPHTVISVVAFLCLPQAFHVAVVENDSPAQLRTARWLYPTYLIALSALMVPVACAGRLTFGTSINPDTYMITLPVVAGAGPISLIAFLGGLSAAAGMVIVAVVALSTMLCNDVAVPLLLRSRGRTGVVPTSDLTRTLLRLRRAGVITILGLAYAMERSVDQRYPLTQIGLMSFVAVAQFGPAFLGGLYWRRASRMGVLAGLACGFAVWGWSLLLPATGQVLSGTASMGMDETSRWPGSLPSGLFGAEILDPISQATVWSLAANTCAFVLVSLLSRPSAVERSQAAIFVDGIAPRMPTGAWQAILRLSHLRDLSVRLVGPERGGGAFDAYVAERRRNGGPALSEAGFADRDAVRFTENLVAGAIGAPSARVVMAASLEGRSLSREAALAMLDEASDALRFSRHLLERTLENVSQGIVVVDGELRVMAWNSRFLALLSLPSELVRVGLPLSEVIAYNAARGEYGAEEWPALIVNRDIGFETWPYNHVRRRPDGTALEASWNRLPDGGFVATYADVTDREQTADALRESNERLEERIRERTRELQAAKAAADAANASKTLFLAAAGHDLLQPLNAARLFAAALEEDLDEDGRLPTLARNVSRSLASAERLIATILDISALDAGAVTTSPRTFLAEQVLSELRTEFEALAAAKGLSLRVVRSRLAVRSDPDLLRRILQNFLSNAVRHTSSGGVVLGCRRREAEVVFEVWDSGPGIPSERHREIFAEFRRLDPDAGPGLGLGLAIVERIARLLGHRVALQSTVGRGSRFAVSVPREFKVALEASPTVLKPTAPLGRVLALCIDDDVQVLSGMTSLLESWGARCVPARNLTEALEALAGAKPQVVLADRHLRDGADGLAALATLRERWGVRVPAALVTADRSESTRAVAQAACCEVLYKPLRPAALRRYLSGIALARTAAGVTEEGA